MSARGHLRDIYLARHGESQNNPLPEERHVPDPELTALGTFQAARLARRLAGARPTLVLSSPLVRALATAAPLVAATGAPWVVWEDLAEAHRAHPGDGQEVAALRARFPGARFAHVAHWPGHPGSETPETALARARRLSRRLAALPEGPIAVIGHQNINGYLLRVWLGILAQAPVRLRQDNAAIHHLRLGAGAVEWVRGNDATHLEGHP